MAFDYADERLRINALRKNTLLPKELQVYDGVLKCMKDLIAFSVSFGFSWLQICNGYSMHVVVFLTLDENERELK